MLCGDYITYSKKSNQSGGSPHCRAFGDKDADEDILHIVTQCSGYSEIREKKLDELNTLCQGANQIDIHKMTKRELCQFLLGPTSLNLNSRINPMDLNLNNFLEISRSMCNYINNRRLKVISEKKN